MRAITCRLNRPKHEFMSTTQNDSDWVKMSARRPVLADLPVWVYTKDKYIFTVNSIADFRAMDTHWKPATLPAPPAVERSQHELDVIAYYDWHNTGQWGRGSDEWHAALAYRDAQNAADLQQLFPSNGVAEGDIRGLIDRLRKRCGLSK